MVKNEAYKNLKRSPQYVDSFFSGKLLAFPLRNGTVIIRSHITNSQSLGINPATPWAALHSDGKVNVATVLLGNQLLPTLYTSASNYLLLYYNRLGRVCIHVSA